MGSATKWKVQPNTHNRRLGSGMMSVKTDRDSCPPDCPLRRKGCFGNNFPMVMHWEKVPETGVSASDAAFFIKREPPNFVRIFEVGDAPKDKDGEVDWRAMNIVDSACKKHTAWGYSHHTEADVRAGMHGLKNIVMNVSTNNRTEAAEAFKAGHDVVTIIDKFPAKSWREDGVRYIACPKQMTKGKTCKSCCNGNTPLCGIKNRGYVVAFVPNGTKKKAVLTVIQ